MPQFDEGKIQSIKSMVDIVDIIGRSLDLRKSGRNNFVALCPFHQERTPSFSVSSERQRYHCFGCGRGGDVIQFVEDHEGIGFVETMEYLAALGHKPLIIHLDDEEPPPVPDGLPIYRMGPYFAKMESPYAGHAG